MEEAIVHYCENMIKVNEMIDHHNTVNGQKTCIESFNHHQLSFTVLPGF